MTLWVPAASVAIANVARPWAFRVTSAPTFSAVDVELDRARRDARTSHRPHGCGEGDVLAEVGRRDSVTRNDGGRGSQERADDLGDREARAGEEPRVARVGGGDSVVADRHGGRGERPPDHRRAEPLSCTASTVKVIVPVAVDGLTVAVKVTLLPKTDGLRLLTRLVAVASWMTDCVSTALVLAALLTSPL